MGMGIHELLAVPESRASFKVVMSGRSWQAGVATEALLASKNDLEATAGKTLFPHRTPPREGYNSGAHPEES